MALFGEAVWRRAPPQPDGGLRETWESKQGSYNTSVSGGLATTTASLVTDKNSILRAQSYSSRVSEDGLSGRINLAWTVTRDVQLYVNGASGQKSGGSTCRACRSILRALRAMPMATRSCPPP
jgi:iron complex outermembrane receptor protein